MVRILKVLEPDSSHIRWLDHESTGNEVRAQSLRYSFQHSLPKVGVLATSEFDHGLRNAMNRYAIRVPSLVDGWLRFDQPRQGFVGIIIEAKSGTQSFGEAVYQLKCYRAAIKDREAGRLLVWGITEHEDDSWKEFENLSDHQILRSDPDDDLWVFSSADRIPGMMQELGFAGVVQVSSLERPPT